MVERCYFGQNFKDLSMKNSILLIGTLLCFFAAKAGAQPIQTIEVPERDAFCRIDTAGKSVLPSGRYIQPAGQTFRIARGAFGLAVSPDQEKALVLHNNGVLSLVDLKNPANLQQAPKPEALVAMARQEIRFNPSAYLGVAWADNQIAYRGEDGSVVVWDTRQMRKVDSISLNGICDGQNYVDL